MSTDLLRNIKEQLNEEKWTRAALNSYTIGNFQKLDNLIKNTNEEGLQEEVKQICDEHLAHTKNSIIGLYISGIISLSRHLVDDTNLILLTEIFSDNHKWNIVEYLCNKILEFGENKYSPSNLGSML